MILKTDMTLYHGTNAHFERIEIKEHSSAYKDFGEGFYLTSSKEQARVQARRKAKGNDPAYVYVYKVLKFDSKQYNILELLQYNEEWVKFLTYNRVFGGNTEKFSKPEWANLDIVYDRMADNKYNRIDINLKNYGKGLVTADDVIKELSWDKKWDQYCFKTERSLELLSRLTVILC